MCITHKLFINFSKFLSVSLQFSHYPAEWCNSTVANMCSLHMTKWGLWAVSQRSWQWYWQIDTLTVKCSMHVINAYYIVISITITITDSTFHITITITMDFFSSITIILLLHQYFVIITITITITITYYPMSASVMPKSRTTVGKGDFRRDSI